MAETKKTVSKKETPINKVEIPDILTFLKAGVHFGHKKSSWNPRMKKYIYEERNGVHIIDLVQTQELTKIALKAVAEFAQKGNVLIVGTKGQAATAIQTMAEENGAFYINKRWPGGLFTNFKTIRKSLQNLVKMEEKLARGGDGLVKKEMLMMKRDVDRLNRIYKGIKFMDHLPTAIIVVDSKVEKNAIKEGRLANVPIIALVDTCSDPDLVDYAIPANDDSIKSISLFVELFGKAIKGTKRAESIISLRKNHYAQLDSLNKAYNDEKERLEKMAELERVRLKALREGEEAKTKTGSVVRVIKKKKDITADVEAAEKVKEESKSITDLGLSARTEKALKEAGLKTVKDLEAKNEKELLAIKGVGAKAVEDILKAIK